MTKQINLIELLALFSPRSDFSYRVRIIDVGLKQPGIFKEYIARDLILEHSDHLLTSTIQEFCILQEGAICIYLDTLNHKDPEFVSFSLPDVLNLFSYLSTSKISYWFFDCDLSGTLQLKPQKSVLVSSFNRSYFTNCKNCQVLNLSLTPTLSPIGYVLTINVFKSSDNFIYSISKHRNFGALNND